ncbi:MAG: glycosyltransferase [Nitrospiraceae bacterium]
MKPNTPLVSVIIPTHNCAAFIVDTLKSLEAQTYTNFEIIVVDDGSTDNTGTVLAPYCDRIRCIHQENRGAAAARNAGIRQAQGEFLAFLDADDVWFPPKLELQVQAFKSHPEAGLAFADFLDFDDSGVTRQSRLNTWPEARAWFERHRVEGSEIACGHMYGELLAANWIHASSAIVRRDVLSEVGWFDESLRAGEDLELWLRVAQRYPFLCVNRVLSGYRYRPESLCGSTGSRAMRINRIVVQVLEKHLQNRWIPHGLESKVKAALCRRYWALGWNCFGENRFTESRRFLSQGIRYQPFNRHLWVYWWASFLPLSAIEAVRRLRQRRRNYHLPAEPAARNLSITNSGPEGPHATI